MNDVPAILYAMKLWRLMAQTAIDPDVELSRHSIDVCDLIVAAVDMVDIDTTTAGAAELLAEALETARSHVTDLEFTISGSEYGFTGRA